MRLNSQSGSGKWWSSLQGRGEAMGGNSTLRESLKHMGPGAPEKLGSPGPTLNLRFVFIHDF